MKKSVFTLIHFVALFSLMSLSSCALPGSSEPEQMIDVVVDFDISGVTIYNDTLFSVVGKTILLDNVSVSGSLSGRPEPTEYAYINCCFEWSIPTNNKDEWLSILLTPSSEGEHRFSVGARYTFPNYPAFNATHYTGMALVVVEDESYLPKDAAPIGTFRYSYSVNHPLWSLE